MMWQNQTTRHLELDQYEPSLSDYADLKRWDKWLAWNNKRTLACCFTGVNRYVEDSKFLHKKKLHPFNRFKSKRKYWQGESVAAKYKRQYGVTL